MAQSYLRNPSVERLPVILEELHRGSLRIPPFQRDFEWSGEQRLALYSSVRMGLPTGALVVWRTSHRLPVENRFGPYLLPPSHSPRSDYLLDGFHRLTTLYAALAAGFWTREGRLPPSPTMSTAPDGSAWAILFDLDTDEFLLASSKNLDRHNGEIERHLLPLAVLFDDAEYDDWRSRERLSREHLNRARALRTAFADYLVPVVPLVTDDIDVVLLTFKRINGLGVPMGAAAMTRALTWGPGFDLRDEIGKVREELNPYGWGALEDDALLKAVAVVARLDPTQINAETLAARIQAQPSIIQTAGDRVQEAAELLGYRLGIAGPTALPYQQLLLFVVRAVEEAGGVLSQEQEDKLTAWMAEACLDARLVAPPHVIRAEWHALANRLGLPAADPPRPMDKKHLVAKECWVFSMAWARSRTTALVLAAAMPRDTAATLFGVSPTALVARGADNFGMLLADGAEGLPVQLREHVAADKRLKVALRSPANRVVCLPGLLPGLRAALLQPDCPETLRQSHLITPEAHNALLADDLEGFFELRRAAIIAAEERWVEERGGKVEILREPRPYAEG